MANSFTCSRALLAHLAERLLGVILTLHAGVGVLWWWLSPGGFPISHLRFWSNSVFPVYMVIASLLAIWAGHSKRRRIRLSVMLGFVFAWCAFAISTRTVFQITFRFLWLVPLSIGNLIGILALLESQHATGTHITRRMIVAALLTGALLGYALPRTQHAAPPDTRPLNEQRVDNPASIDSPSGALVQMASGLQILPNAAFIDYFDGPRRLTVWPLLTFRSRSQDACWTVLAGPRERIEPERRLKASGRSGSRLILEYDDDGVSVLDVNGEHAPDLVEIDARSTLEQPIWSHLNTFTMLMVNAAGPLSLSFSPCPGERIAAQSLQEGMPAKFAYLDPKDHFHLAEARRAEKGPFRELASARLDPGTPLVITFFEKDLPIFRVSLADWAKQAGRQLSPTAGWGVPVNAIELLSDQPESVQVFVTLAATSVGRGFDTVGHAPGLYANRMTIEKLPARP